MAQTDTTKSRRPSRWRRAIVAVFLGAAMTAAAHAGGTAVALCPTGVAEWQQTDPKKMSAEEQFAMGQKAQGADNDKEAAKWYRLAAERDHIQAQVYLASFYASGSGVAEDDKQAAKWYRKAADQGDKFSQCMLGIYYKNGQGVKQNRDEAIKWFRLAAAQGDKSAAEQLIKMSESYGVMPGQTFQSSKQTGQMSADEQCQMGSKYRLGTGVAKDDEEAAKWYRLAANQGFAEAEFRLACLYSIGEGVGKDYGAAAILFGHAADKGLREAAHCLGVMYQFGVGVAKDLDEAYKWYTRASGYYDAKMAAWAMEQSGYVDPAGRTQTARTTEQTGGRKMSTFEIIQKSLEAAGTFLGEVDKIQQARRGGGQGARGASGGGGMENCFLCGGSKICTACYGVGRCIICNGTHKCSKCGGTGKLPKGSGGGGSSSGSSSSGSSSSDRREDCPVCLGLKTCPNRDCRDGWVDSPYGVGHECTYCKGSGKCYKCNGTGKK